MILANLKIPFSELCKTDAFKRRDREWMFESWDYAEWEELLWEVEHGVARRRTKAKKAS